MREPQRLHPIARVGPGHRPFERLLELAGALNDEGLAALELGEGLRIEKPWISDAFQRRLVESDGGADVAANREIVCPGEQALEIGRRRSRVHAASLSACSRS